MQWDNQIELAHSRCKVTPMSTQERPLLEARAPSKSHGKQCNNNARDKCADEDEGHLRVQMDAADLLSLLRHRYHRLCLLRDDKARGSLTDHLFDTLDIVAHDPALQSCIKVIEGRHSPVTFGFAQHLVGATPELEPACCTPICAPTIAHNPVFYARGRLSPSSDLHHVVDLGFIVDLVRDVNALMLQCILLVVKHEIVISGERTRNRPASIDLLHHGGLAGDIAVAADTVPDPLLHREASIFSGEAIATNILWRATHVFRLVGHA
mmetsp:Transcript_56983/g.144618  ORF Transcript_56983/g.144618 Transcript_56983/m.144618 type:complete len:266 (-) Transcript_56983:541-1338(-)